MTPELAAAFAKLETGSHDLATHAKHHTEQIAIVVARLDQIIHLLTPNESDEPTLSDLLGHMIMIGREQLILARQSVQMLARIEQRLDNPAAGDSSKASNGRSPL
jgi:hypothetical protein